MIQRALASKGLVAYVIACATGITLYFRWPFPEGDLVLHFISIRAPLIYTSFKYTYTLSLFTTPYIAYSLVLSGLYVFAFRPNPFFSPLVQLQTERAHRVIADGPYKYMRHPAYFDMLISIPASALAMGSWFALVPVIVFALVLTRRTGLEDEFLSYNLPGYAEYANHVPGRLFPIKKPKKDLYVKHSA